MSTLEAIDGYWLSFDGEEKKLIQAALEAGNYTADHDGLKQWILDACEDELDDDGRDATERIRRKAQEYRRARRERSGSGLLDAVYEYARSNPEGALRQAQQAAAFIGSLMQKGKVSQK